MYLAFGMTPEQYWEGPPELATAYRKKSELESELRNEGFWLQGTYIYDALTSVVSQVFASKKSDVHTYAEKPYRITPLTEEELAKQKEEEARKAREHAIAQFNLLKESWDRKNGRPH